MRTSGVKNRPHVNWMGENGVALVTLSNGPLNVLNGRVSADLSECADEIRDHSLVRVVVITGAGGRAFSAGGDIKGFPEVLRGTDAEEFWRRNRIAMENFASLPQPIIAAIHGFAYGGGFELTLACDLSVADRSAKFCLPEIKIGLFPDGGGTQRLPRLVGASRAKEMMFFGEPITAEEAYRIGLVDRLVPEGQALAEALALARSLGRYAASGASVHQTGCGRGLRQELKAGLQLEGELFDNVFQTADAQEGIKAFLEKRQPRFNAF